MGVAFAPGPEDVALVLAIVIGLQNIPDGFAFAVPVSQSGASTPKVLLDTTLSGTVPQVLASVFGFGLVAVASGLFPVAAGFAAGAMLAVVLREMVPSSHGHGYADAATAAFLVGFVLLVVVDTAVAVGVPSDGTPESGARMDPNPGPGGFLSAPSNTLI